MKWLQLLASADPQKAFTLLDGPNTLGTTWNADLFLELLNTFSGDPGETYSYTDILFDRETLEDCYEDSSVTMMGDGKVYALLYFPLPSRGHTLVIDFHFIPEANGSFRVVLNCDNNLLVL